MKILITGGSGFIGSHLADFLISENHQIILAVRSEHKAHNITHLQEKIQIDKIDVSNYDKIERSILKHKPDIIFHLAGETSHKKSFETPFEDVKSNSISTLNILEIIRKSNLNCKFILGSTFIVIGKNAMLPINEETPCNPSTMYGAHRLLSEHYCKIYHNVYGIDTIIFRITNCFGPREQYKIPNKNALNYMIYNAYKNKTVSIFNEGKFFRDVIFVSDVINALSVIMKKGESGNVYWIANGAKTWFYEIGKCLEEFTNTQVEYVQSPEYTSKTDVGDFLVDNTKLSSLGWTSNVTLRNGIKKTLDFFKENNL
ncbi:MAG: NAD-dependent epimerase/dehydratase family protein [Candidatus Nitrosopumilus sp. bin_32a]